MEEMRRTQSMSASEQKVHKMIQSLDKLEDKHKAKMVPVKEVQPEMTDKEARARPEILLKTAKFRKFHSKYTKGQHEETERHSRMIVQQDRLSKEARAEFNIMVNR
jgi:gamma-glutamylcysteine synthetase